MRFFPYRTQPLRGRVAILVLTLALSACGVSPPPPGVLVVAQVAEPRSLDPQVTTALNDFRILVNVYQGLVRFRPGSLEPEPALAQSWEVDAEGLDYTFRLRPGVRFHDGTPLDAAAVRFNFQRMLDPEHPAHHTGPFPLAFFFEAVDQIQVLDPLTLRFRLQEPFAPFLSNLAYPTGLLVSPAAVRRWGRDYGRHPCGTGPFRFVEWDAGRRVLLERNPDYWGPAPPLERVAFRPVTDPMTRVAELMAGGVDLALELSPDNVAALRERTGFRVHEQEGPHLWFLILNLREGPFRDLRMRQAVNYALDKRSLVKDVLRDTASVAAGPIPAAFAWARDPELAPYPHDPERARSLIRAAGYQDGVEVSFLVPRGGSGMLAPVQMASAIQGDLAQVGIRARIETYEWNAFLARVNEGLAGKADMAEMAWMTNDPDTLPYLALRSGAMPESGGFNSGYYSNPDADRLIEQARRSNDRADRARLYRELSRLVQADAPWLFVASWRQNAVTRERVQGFALEPSFFLDLARTGKTP